MTWIPSTKNRTTSATMASTNAAARVSFLVIIKKPRTPSIEPEARRESDIPDATDPPFQSYWKGSKPLGKTTPQSFLVFLRVDSSGAAWSDQNIGDLPSLALSGSRGRRL